MLTDDHTVRTTLVSGDPELCKAFLFEAAIYWAKQGLQVYCIAPKQFEYLPPIFHGRSEPSANTLRLISFIYPSDYDELLSLLVRLPTFARIASVVLLDEFDTYCSSRDAKSWAQLCAALLNAAEQCSSDRRPVRICATTTGLDQKQEARGWSHCLKMYFDEKWNLQMESDDACDTEDIRKVSLKNVDRGSIELCWLNDGALVLRKIFA
ncbi:hypothetical protein QAD02_017717 [Eretmocerus hayati]|uniref:Uncharacterized protein n=1 Tax=Eretmocerus hayati TaxID=131215 RepID=A0ACC2PEF4_9HYME|nr:hypothetical protein QAD02_017717 [Eretmocerus hayati]